MLNHTNVAQVAIGPFTCSTLCRQDMSELQLENVTIKTGPLSFMPDFAQFLKKSEEEQEKPTGNRASNYYAKELSYAVSVLNKPPYTVHWQNDCV